MQSCARMRQGLFRTHDIMHYNRELTLNPGNTGQDSILFVQACATLRLR